jgi:hypothetical protein
MQKDEHSGIITFAVKKMKDAELPTQKSFSLSQYGHSAVLLPIDGAPAYKPGAVFRKTPAQYAQEPF